MPTINKLGGNKNPAVEHANEMKRAEDAAREETIGRGPDTTLSLTGTEKLSLIESKGNGANLSRVKVPSFLQTSMPETSERELTGYIGFCSEKSKHYPEQQAAGLSDGDIFLFHQGQYLKCPQLEFFLVSGESFKSVMDRDGKFLYATRDLSIKEAHYKVQGKPRIADNESNPKLQPHYICLCIVNLNGQLVPIKGDFSGTKSGGIESAISAVRAAGDPKSGWQNLSEAHRTTAAFPTPFGRVYHQMRTAYNVAKTGGNSYYNTKTVSGPANLAQMETLMTALADDSFNKTLEEAHKNYVARVEFMDKIVKGENPYAQQA